MKSVLILVPFDNIYPPMNGGAQRFFNIIHQLAIHFDLTLITLQAKESFLRAAKEYPAIKDIKIYSTKDELPVKDIFNFLPSKFENALRYRWIRKQIRDSADSLFLQYYPTLRKLLKANKYEVVILEGLINLNAVSTVRKYAPSIRIVYDAHNVDSNLAKNAVERFGMKARDFYGIQKAESSLHKTVDAIFTCSKKDHDDFIRMNNNQLTAAVIPNGVNIGNLFDEGVRQDKPGYILFCGSLWSPPNSEGLSWFYQNVWPSVTKVFPDLKLLVVGSGKVPDSLNRLINDPSVQFTGTIDDVRPSYNKAAIAIVPLLTGSGTRLKILEAMGLGVPVVSTTIGAEGIDYTVEKDILIADTEAAFADQIIVLLNCKTQRLNVQQNARKLVEEKYDWNIIGDSLAKFINKNKKSLKTIKLNFGFFWKEFDNNNNYFIRLLSKRYNVVISDDPDFYIFTHPYYNGKKDYLQYKCHRIFFGYENVRADWNICDYVFDSDYSDNPRHKRYPLWSGYDIKKLTLPKDLKDFKQKKKFCCMLVSNPDAKERIEFFHKLSSYKKVDSAGRYLNNIGYPVENKIEFIKDYKFVISFENSSYPGYTTEKLIEPMLVNSIPIYWGNPVVGDDFNTNSFINVTDFKSYDEAVNYIIELDNNKGKYLEMASQPWFSDNKIADEFSEESVLDFFDFIVKDSKKKTPIAKSFYKKIEHQKFILKNNIRLIIRKFIMSGNLN